MRKPLHTFTLSLLMGLLTLQSLPARADRDDDHDRGRHEHRDRRDDRRDDDRDDRWNRDDHRHRHDHDDDDDDDDNRRRRAPRVGGYFVERERISVYEYYGYRPRPGCPPGMVITSHGCRPLGKVKLWKVGQTLPPYMSRRPVEAEVRVRMGNPPAGYEFVRVAGDILLIAVGTSMVIDAIEDIQR